VKYKITQAKAQELNEVELGDGVFLNDKEKDALRSMGYTIYTNGNSYKLRWVNDGE
jgi:hypothetical protein